MTFGGQSMIRKLIWVACLSGGIAKYGPDRLPRLGCYVGNAI